VPGPVSAGEVADRPRRPCSRPSGGSPSSSVVCSIVKGPSPHSVPNRSPSGSILRDRGSESVPIRSRLGSSPCLESGILATGLGFLSGTRARRPELGRNPAGPSVVAHEAAGRAVPRFHRYRVPPWQSGSESRPSPIQRRATRQKRDALTEENPGSFEGVQVRRCREGVASGGGGIWRASTPRRFRYGRDVTGVWVRRRQRCRASGPRIRHSPTDQCDPGPTRDSRTR